MGILDKLKPQPRWKHSDPAVRLEALRDLEDQPELRVLAQSDPDARVRRAAVARVAAPDVLGIVAASDADLETRDRATDRLVALASSLPRTNGSSNGTASLDVALAAIRELTDARRLSTIAKSEAPDGIVAPATWYASVGGYSAAVEATVPPVTDWAPPVSTVGG